MSGYVKLFGDTLNSSIWCESNEVRIVWITLLLMKDRDHMVKACVQRIAETARVSLEDCEKAIAKFLAPDKNSLTEEHEGRRIERVAGGFMILNGEKYRRKMDGAEMREYKRVKAQEYRDKAKGKKKGPDKGMPWDKKALPPEGLKSIPEAIDDERNEKDFPGRGEDLNGAPV